MNVLNLYVCLIILYSLTTATDEHNFQQYQRWENWFLSSGNNPFNTDKQYRALIMDKRRHSLNTIPLPRIEWQIEDRRINLAHRVAVSEIPQTLQE